MKRILIVEDDQAIRELLAYILEGEGYLVREAGNGREAMDALSVIQLPCVVLLDLMMPLMDGFQVLEAMAKDASFADLPVVITTATPMNEFSNYPGVKAVIHKPYDFVELLSAIQRVSVVQ